MSILLQKIGRKKHDFSELFSAGQKKRPVFKEIDKRVFKYTGRQMAPTYFNTQVVKWHPRI